MSNTHECRSRSPSSSPLKSRTASEPEPVHRIGKNHTHVTHFDDGVWAPSRAHGFLPKIAPLARLPDEPFGKLQTLLDEMPVFLNEEENERGLLGRPGALEEAVDELPDFTSSVRQIDPDDKQQRPLLGALFRGYSFLASAFLLEPAYHQYQSTKEYGQARNYLPPQIARPFVHVSEVLGVFPWLDYHYAYSLYNWTIKDESLPSSQLMRWDNLAMCVRFSGQPDEEGFIMLHVHIDSLSGPLVGSAVDTIEAAEKAIAADPECGVTSEEILCLDEHVETMKKINAVRREMWIASRWRRYNDFRVFIMGTEGNDEIFGEGVVYQGVAKFGGSPQVFRGQTGAQDDIIPFVDTFSGLTSYYPENELTSYLLDLRNYRPPVIQAFVKQTERRVEQLKLPARLRSNCRSALRLLQIVEQVWEFRNGHWQFVLKYIMSNTKYSRATGGTPITTWIPNQIEAALAYMHHIVAGMRPMLDELNEFERTEFNRIDAALTKRTAILHRQVAELGRANYDAKLVYDLEADEAEGPRPGDDNE